MSLCECIYIQDLSAKDRLKVLSRGLLNCNECCANKCRMCIEQCSQCSLVLCHECVMTCVSHHNYLCPDCDCEDCKINNWQYE